MYGNVTDGREGPLRGFTGRYAHMAGTKKVMVDGVFGGVGRGGSHGNSGSSG